MLYSALLTMDDISLEVGIEIRGIPEDLNEATDPILSFILCLLLDVDTLVLTVKAAEQSVEKLKKFQRRFIIKFNKTEVAHEGRAV